MSDPIIRYDPPPPGLVSMTGVRFVDEFIAKGVDIHFEAMGESQFWIGITDPTSGRMWHINCGAINPRARGYSRVDEESQP